MINKKLSILISALNNRNFIPLYQNLKHQQTKDVEILVNCDSGKYTSGQKRNQLIKQSSGEYIVFVDDDDEVADDYVLNMLNGCKAGKDIVSFNLQQKVNDKLKNIQTLRVYYKDGEKLNGKVGMSANHLCAWKKKLATQVSWREDLGYGDDQLWYKPLLSYYSDITEHHIDKVLYYYNFNYATTANQNNTRVKYSQRTYKGGLNVYANSQGIYVQDKPLSMFALNKNNELVKIENMNLINKVEIK